jgi:hypothetical protein
LQIYKRKAPLKHFTIAKRLPLFEQWLIDSEYGYLNNNVRLPEDIELLGWYFEYDQYSQVKKRCSFIDTDRVSLPVGDYIIKQDDFEYIYLVIDDGTEKHSYVVKRGDFEEIKEKVKA